MKSGLIAVGALCLAVCVSTPLLTAQTPAPAAPSFSPAGQLVRPSNYREWVYVSSGLGMAYGPVQSASDKPMFDNVFVTPAAYREFLRSGTWPDKTMFVLEVREALANASINMGGRSQGAVVGMEASVKDLQRFPNGGWGYFSFDGGKGLADATSPLPQTAVCYACHRTNTAVDNTFVQFYPTLFEAARRAGTIKPTYKP